MNRRPQQLPRVQQRMEPGGGACGGFTMIELTVVLGLLAAFMMFLLQLLSTGVSLFDEGEAGQELADIGNTAAAAARDSVADMAGPRRQSYEPGRPDARLLVQWVPLGLGEPGAAGALVQAVRATVRISQAREDLLLRGVLHADALETAESLAPPDVEARLTELVAQAPRQGRADMLLMAWPAGDPDEAFLDLRRGLWLPGQRIALDRRRAVELMELDRIDERGLSVGVVEASTTPIASGLLHVEFAFASQYTTSFEARGEGRPETVWDSARAGLLVDDENPDRQFSLDLGQPSLEDTTDDVFPRLVQVTLVVARSGREAVLAGDLTSSSRELRVLSMAPLEALDVPGFVKIGPEWVRFTSVSGDRLTGLQRGQRGTVAVPHPRRTKLRAGKTVSITVPLAHGRDNWNG